ncbi:MAG: NusA-like transcription termination signal-binding factor [Candidatus Hadarchaeota archaeon]
MTVKLSSEELRYIALFEGLTGARIKDCVVDEDHGLVTFVVSEGDMGLAIGKGGIRIKKVKNAIGKTVGVFEYSDDPEGFLKNILKPAKVNSVKFKEEGDRRVAEVTVDPMDKGVLLGKGGKRILNAKKLAQRHHQIGDIVVK